MNSSVKTPARFPKEASQGPGRNTDDYLAGGISSAFRHPQSELVLLDLPGEQSLHRGVAVADGQSYPFQQQSHFDALSDLSV